MYSQIQCFVVLTISWLAYGSSYVANDFVSTSNNLLLDILTKSCSSDGIPVCGIRHNNQYVKFPNECLLKDVNKNIFLGMTYYKQDSLKPCIYRCHFSCPKIYAPICAKNLETHEKKMFSNLCEVKKLACKRNMGFIRLSLQECETDIVLNKSNKTIELSESLKKRTIPCTNIVNTVCASYLGVKSTFKNECLLNAENIKFNRGWRIVKMGTCVEDYPNPKPSTHKPSKLHSIKKRSYAQNSYDTNNFVNGVYDFTHTAFQTQFLDQSNQQPMNIANALSDILKKFVAMPTTEEEENIPNYKNVAYVETENEPMPFAPNELNFNYIPIETSGVNTFLNANSNKDYFYTFDKVQPNLQTQNMGFESSRSDSEQIPSENNEQTPDVERMNLENIESNHETEQINEITTIFSVPIPTTSQPEATKKFKLLKEEKNSKKNQKCKFGTLPICGVIPDGTVQTFASICEMMTTNIYLKNTWTKLHEGECGICKYNCTRDYQPICITRNGVNYTMVNDCFFNMGICMDKKSVWKKIANGECELYTRIPDKYENSKPGYPYTSTYFVSAEKTTHMNTIASSTPLPTTITVATNKPLRSKFRKSKIRKSSSKRVVNRRSSASKNSSKELSTQDITFTTYRPTTRLSLYGPHTNSYIMRLVNERGKFIKNLNSS